VAPPLSDFIPISIPHYNPAIFGTHVRHETPLDALLSLSSESFTLKFIKPLTSSLPSVSLYVYFPARRFLFKPSIADWNYHLSERNRTNIPNLDFIRTDEDKAYVKEWRKRQWQCTLGASQILHEIDFFVFPNELIFDSDYIEWVPRPDGSHYVPPKAQSTKNQPRATLSEKLHEYYDELYVDGFAIRNITHKSRSIFEVNCTNIGLIQHPYSLVKQHQHLLKLTLDKYPEGSGMDWASFTTPVAVVIDNNLSLIKDSSVTFSKDTYIIPTIDWRIPTLASIIGAFFISLFAIIFISVQYPGALCKAKSPDLAHYDLSDDLDADKDVAFSHIDELSRMKVSDRPLIQDTEVPSPFILTKKTTVRKRTSLYSAKSE